MIGLFYIISELVYKEIYLEWRNYGDIIHNEIIIIIITIIIIHIFLSNAN
jgi:hypothetical protein